jgi:ubiquinone/menaquinone biosynthesis C-methylase UbiE
MVSELSSRLREIVDALPLESGMRVLEIGGAPGAAARAVATRVEPNGHVLVVDRSVKGIERTLVNCRNEVASGLISVMCAPVENFEIDDSVPLFDLAFACRVGAFDGRHPRLYDAALASVRRAVVPGSTLYIDTGSPLTPVALE